MSPEDFVAFWLKGHKHKVTDDATQVLCRRIEWRYIDDDVAAQMEAHR